VVCQWEPSRASAVQVQVADNPLFARGIVLDTTASGHSVNAGALRDGTYYWRLRAAGGQGSFWSAPTRFGVLQAAPESKPPADWALEVEATPAGDSVLLKGSIKPKARVTVNDVEVAVDRDGSFLGTFSLPARGPKGRPVVVCAFDDKGHEKSWERYF